MEKEETMRGIEIVRVALPSWGLLSSLSPPPPPCLLAPAVAAIPLPHLLWPIPQTLSAAFTAGAVRGYLPAIQRLAEESCAKWAREGGTLDGLEVLRAEGLRVSQMADKFALVLSSQALAAHGRH